MAMWCGTFVCLGGAGIILGVVMGHNRGNSVVKRVWGDRKCPMASGTKCEVEYEVDENLEMIYQIQPVAVMWKYKSPVNI